MPATIVVIPARNEAERIGRVLAGVRAELPEANVVVVDDGSQDATAAIASRAGARVVRHAFSLGYGAALQTGYRFARLQPFDRLVQLDADGQHDPASLHDLLARLDREDVDLVIGSRYLNAGDAPRGGKLRRVGSKMFAWLVTSWTGVRITDPTSGYQAMNRRTLELLVLDHFPEDYPDADVLILASRAGLRLAEVPVRMHPRSGGVSMHRGSRAAYYLYKMVLNLALLPVRRSSPFRDGRADAKAAAAARTS